MAVAKLVLIVVDVFKVLFYRLFVLCWSCWTFYSMLFAA